MNNANQHIPAGYKSSPLGIIPEDWEVKRLGEYVTIMSGESPSLYELMASGKYPYVKVEDMNNCAKYQSQSREYSNDNRNVVPKGSVIFPKRGAAILNNKVRIAQKSILMDSNMMAITANEFFLDSEYLYYSIINEQLYKIADTSTIPQINNKHIIPYRFRLPILKEQQRIVSVLSLWDTAISKQTQLVEKLTLRKRGLMQQLLTGKKRLKGFDGEWKEVKLGEVCAFLSNNTLSREQLNNDNGEVQNIHYGDVLIKYPSVLDCNKIVLPFLNEGTYKESMNDFIYDGDLIISDTAEDETVGKACEVQNVGNRKILAGLHTMLLRPNAGIFAPYFLGYYINSEAYHGKLLPLIQGIKVCSIGKQAIQNTILNVPSIKEQNAIASVLIQADKEIELANEKLTRLQEEKKGLMQVLLSGKKRVK